MKTQLTPHRSNKQQSNMLESKKNKKPTNQTLLQLAEKKEDAKL